MLYFIKVKDELNVVIIRNFNFKNYLKIVISWYKANYLKIDFNYYPNFN